MEGLVFGVYACRYVCVLSDGRSGGICDILSGM